MSELTAATEYDAWFEANDALFASELRAIERQHPDSFEDAVEVGCGTGLFAERLGVTHGIEPSAPMAARARERGLTVDAGRAEDVPLATHAVELALALGVLGYVDDVDRALAELARIVEPGGDVVVAFLRAGSSFASLYETAVEQGSYPTELQWERPYPIEMARRADWRSADTVLAGLRSAGFADLTTVQTLTRPPAEAVQSVEPPTTGHDRGSWVVVHGIRRE